jgi:drug/metabolite transporter (DMT)-like permease
MSKRNFAIIGATIVSLIYGVTFSIAKDVMPLYIEPYGFIVLRVLGATLLFWVVSLFTPREKITSSDYLRIAAAAFFGVAFNMLTFFKGLSYTSPIISAVLMVTTPILVLIFSAIIVKEKLQLKKVIGIVLGLSGATILILYGKKLATMPHAMLGNFLVFINAVSYAFYLIIVKKLMDKYNAFTFVKWIYTVGFFMVLPFGWSEIEQVVWNSIPTDIYYKIGFVVLFSTFFTYLLNLLSMRQLSPTTVAVFMYLQPLFATIFAISMGKDSLDAVKIGSALLVFLGVYLVVIKKT